MNHRVALCVIGPIVSRAALPVIGNSRIYLADHHDGYGNADAPPTNLWRPDGGPRRRTIYFQTRLHVTFLLNYSFGPGDHEITFEQTRHERGAVGCQTRITPKSRGDPEAGPLAATRAIREGFPRT